MANAAQRPGENADAISSKWVCRNIPSFLLAAAVQSPGQKRHRADVTGEIMSTKFLATTIFVLSASTASADNWAGTLTSSGSYTQEQGIGLVPQTQLSGAESVMLQCSNLYPSTLPGSFNTCPNASNTTVNGYWVPVSSFAKASSVDALQTQVTVLSDTVSGFQSQFTVLGNNITTLQSQIGGFASAASVSGLQTQVGALGASLSALDARVARIESLPGIKQLLRNKKNSLEQQTAMISALAPTAPNFGNANRLGFNGAMEGDQSAFAINYVHASGGMDVNFGVAVSEDSTMARAGFGFSW